MEKLLKAEKHRPEMAIFYCLLPVLPISDCKLIGAWSISVIIFAYGTREAVLSLVLGTTVILMIYNGSVIFIL